MTGQGGAFGERSPERAAGAAPRWEGAPQLAAQTGAAITEHHAAPVPKLTAGAVDPDAAPAVTHGWAAALTGEKAHWVPEGAPRGEHNSRLTGLTLEGYDAFIDEQGLAEGAELPPCRTCCRKLARLSAPSEPTQP